MAQYVSIDIGGTSIKYGLIDEGGRIIVRKERNTEAAKGGRAILAKVFEIIEGFLQQGSIDGVCISTAGMVDPEKGEIVYAAPLIPEYTGTKFKESIEAYFHVPCEVENDVNCAGLAEAVSGAGAGSNLVLTLTIGTGIGGSLIMNQKIFHGFSNSACEIGYMHINGSDFQSLGAASILTSKVSFLKNEPADLWDGRHIFAEAKKGDSICNQAINEMVDILGIGIANICYVVNPEVVVLGGGIMAQEEFLKGQIEAAVNRRLIPHIAKHTRIAFAKHKNDAGMLGAYYHFLNCR